MLNFEQHDVERLAQTYKVIPIVKTLFAGSESPVGIFSKVASDVPGGFLLESAEQGIWARYSFIGAEPRGMLLATENGVRFESRANESPLPSPESELPDSVFEALRSLTRHWNAPTDIELPPLTAGLVGVIGWDLIRGIENLGPGPKPDFRAPLLSMVQIGDLIVVDHATAELKLVANIYVTEGCNLVDEYRNAVSRIELMEQKLLAPAAPFMADIEWAAPSPDGVNHPSVFLDAVAKAKHYVEIGDVFQVVLSQRFDHVTNASAVDIYRTLRALNPSPYMYLLNLEDSDGPSWVIGSSPEALVKVSGRKAVMHPIAGSRRRGQSVEEDARLATELAGDPKERAEHLMLVDLARNDLLKVCRPESVNVTEFMQIERFSHIMHLVSTVEGELDEGSDSVEILRATFPAGTLSGAPKPRALEIIDELEPAARGVFGGVVGYFDFAGNADLAIAIRTVFLRDGTAHVQAGAGIVLDSQPELERQETIAKASAPRRAVLAASSLKPITGRKAE